MDKGKKSNFYLISCITGTFLLVSVILFNGVKPFSPSLFRSNADNQTYSLVLDDSNAVSTSGIVEQKTKEYRNNIRIAYSDVSSNSGGHTKLNANGTIYNLTYLSSISSIYAEYESEGLLYFQISYDAQTWSDAVYIYNEQTYEFLNYPYSIKFSTDGEHEVDINKIQFNYACTPNEDAEYGSPYLWNAIEESNVDLYNVTLDSTPYGLKLSYYNDIYSRGFAWATDLATTDSELYIVESDAGELADFSSSLETHCFNQQITDKGTLSLHKAYVEELSPSTTYSYKVGSNAGWKYGVFTTEVDNPTSFTAIQISDAQTKDGYQLNVWENTFAQAIETAGRKLDMIIYNGDQNQQSAPSINNYIGYSGAIETIRPYLNSTPYMSAPGNHDDVVYPENTCIDFSHTSSGISDDNYYSYDYGPAHFAVLYTNRVPGLGIRNNSKSTKLNVAGTDFYVDSNLLEQAEWLIEDLESAHARGAKWIIVTTHAGPHSTGDHSSEDQIKYINESFTPIFSAYHVDLVFQAHDHTYAKTYPYKWDTIGHTTEMNNSNIVNYNPSQTVYGNKTYDLNPNGTYYVTTGAAGHRTGAAEADSGVFADLVPGTKTPLVEEVVTGPRNPNAFTYNTYKTEVGRITQSNSYEPYEVYLSNRSKTYYSSQNYTVGDYAASNVNANMFGILNLNSSSLTYDVYTVRGNEVRLFDTLNVLKRDPEYYVNEINNLLALNDEVGNASIHDVFKLLKDNGTDANELSSFGLNSYFYWDQEDNRVVYADEQYRVIYPKAKEGQTRGDHCWFSLNGKIPKRNYSSDIIGNDIFITGSAIEAGEKLYKLSEDIKNGEFSFNNNNVKTLHLPEEVDLSGAEFTLGIVKNLSIEGENTTLENIVSPKYCSISESGTRIRVGLVSEARGDVLFNNLTIKNSIFGDYSISQTAVFAGNVATSGNLTVENCTVEDCSVYGEQKVGVVSGLVFNYVNVVISNSSFENVHVRCEEGCAGGILGYMDGNNGRITCDSISQNSIRNNVPVSLTKVSDRAYQFVHGVDLQGDASNEVVNVFDSYYNRVIEKKEGLDRYRPGCAVFGWQRGNKLYGEDYIVDYGLRPFHSSDITN